MQEKTALEQHLAQFNLEEVLRGLIADQLIPAMGAAVFRSEAVMALTVAGTRQKWGDVPVMEEDSFHIGANTKALTATLAGRLVSQGRISWETHPAEVLPVLGPTMHPGYRDLTLRHLLQHTAGVLPFTDDDHIEKWLLKGRPREQRVAFAVQAMRTPPIIPPGSQPVYSNAGYVIAGAMLEAVADQDWETLFQQQLLVPLGLSGCFDLPEASASDAVWGHQQRLLWLRPIPPGTGRSPVVLNPASGLRLSLPDYAEFGRMHLRGLRGQRQTVLEGVNLQLLHEAQDGVAMGWGVQTLRSQTAHVHTGREAGFTSLIALLPERDLGMIILANAGDRLTGKICRQLLLDFIEYLSESCWQQPRD